MTQAESAWSDSWGYWQRTMSRLAPPDWFPAPPDFVGIGVQKAGTTWWYRLIETHPQVFTRHYQKERQYFSRFGHREFKAAHAVQYAEIFPRPFGGKAGEWTPGYMSDFWVAPLLAQSAPDTKLLVMLRDPVVRYLSGVRHALNIEKLPLKTAQRDAHVRSFYFRQLEPYLEHFRKEQVLVLQYEQCRADPVREIRRTFEFLELDQPDFVPPNMDVVYNESVGEPFTVGPHVMDVLAKVFRDDAEQLAAAFPSVDLGLWPSLTRF